MKLSKRACWVKWPRQCHLNINHFLRLVDCDMEQDEYEQHLRDNYKI